MKEVNYLKEKRKKAGIGIVVAIILVISSIAIYTNVIKPKKYTEYINEGNQYLSQENYESAIELFEKAIKIQEDSTEARLGEAKGYIGINYINKAIEILKEVQKLDMGNESLLMDILEILGDIDLEISNELIQNYINKVGLNEVSDKFRIEILEFTDKDAINLAIKNAQELYDNAIEGNEEGQYEDGFKALLLSMLEEAKRLNSNYLISQSEVDVMTERLNESIENFENKKIKAFPSYLSDTYRNRLRAIENEIDYEVEYGDLSNAEMGDFLWQMVDKYEVVMNDIYNDLNTYLSSSKKFQLDGEKAKYRNDKAIAQQELEQAHAESPGTWYNTGEPGTMGDVIKEHCYYLIDKYMI